MKISILTPTRQRHKQLIRFEKSVMDNLSNENEVKNFIYIDEDDPQLEQYLDTVLDKNFRHTIVGEPKSVSKSWNDIAKKAIEWGTEILIMGNDDLIYRTNNWDKLILEEHLKIKDGIYCMWMNDLYKKETHCAFPIISNKAYNVLGYFSPGIFHFGYNDTWIFDIFQKIERTFYLDHIIAEHMHVNLGKQKPDRTYYRNRNTNRGNLFKKDSIIWNQTENERNLESNKLLGFIKNEKNDL
jgi:hypothetical protein